VGFSQDVAIKYSAFTLCYNTLLAHLDNLNRALIGDTRELKKSIISQINGALTEQVYRSKPRSLGDAVEIITTRLSSERKAIETMNHDAAEVIDEIVTDIQNRASVWQYEADVEQHRAWGEKLSRLFYEGTPWPTTQERLTTNASVVFRYAGTLDRAVPGQNTYGYKVAPMAFYPKYKDADDGEPEDNVILVRFSFEHDFSTYLAYPFFFFHEYASHIHGANSDSDIFDDGWMMYAIHEFLSNNVYSLPPTYCLHGNQIQAIGEHCPGKISTKHLQDYYFFGQGFHTWSRLWAPKLFRQMTWELAGYPLSQENRYFLADFMERLHYHFEQRRDDLRRKIENYTGVDDLFMRLPPP